MRRLLAALLFCAAPAAAVIETYEFASPELERRYLELGAELRCPKCQNQNIADSNAPIAADLRRQLHSQLHAGRSDAEIADYMVRRYGEFVLYRPRWSAYTAPLWLAPALLLLMGLGLAGAALRRSPRARGRGAMSADERRRLRELLGAGGRGLD